MIRYCSSCKYGELRRMNRLGWFEKVFLSEWLGLYPWECVICRKRYFFRDDGRHSQTSDVFLRDDKPSGR